MRAEDYRYGLLWWLTHYSIIQRQTECLVNWISMNKIKYLCLFQSPDEIRGSLNEWCPSGSHSTLDLEGGYPTNVCSQSHSFTTDDPLILSKERKLGWTKIGSKPWCDPEVHRWQLSDCGTFHLSPRTALRRCHPPRRDWMSSLLQILYGRGLTPTDRFPTQQSPGENPQTERSRRQRRAKAEQSAHCGKGTQQ